MNKYDGFCMLFYKSEVHKKISQINMVKFLKTTDQVMTQKNFVTFKQNFDMTTKHNKIYKIK